MTRRRTYYFRSSTKEKPIEPIFGPSSDWQARRHDDAWMRRMRLWQHDQSNE